MLKGVSFNLEINELINLSRDAITGKTSLHAMFLFND